MSSVTIRQMLEAGVHFGHQTRFWNPRMAPFIFGHRNKIHIINLENTLVMFEAATRYVRQLAANRGTILLVGTKRQAREIVAEEAASAGMPYVDERWLGGMMTNFKTVKGSIKRLKEMEQARDEGAQASIAFTGRMGTGGGPAHERAHPAARLDHAGALELRIHPGDRVGVHTQIDRELPHGGQLVAGLQPSRRHGCPERPLELRIDRRPVPAVDRDDGHVRSAIHSSGPIGRARMAIARLY